MMIFVVTIFVIDFVFASAAASPALSIITTSLGSSGPHTADYSGKVSVSVGSILTQQETAAAAQKGYARLRSHLGTRSVQNDQPLSPPSVPTASPHYDSLYAGGAGTQLPFHSWSPPPVNPDEDFSNIDVHMFGERISSSALNFLEPNLNRETVAKLRVILGSSYEDAWMSPENPGNRSLTGYFPRASDGLRAELDQLNHSLEDGNRVLQLNPNEMTYVKKWLLRKATCPIQYQWRDLGSRFWPRWIRHGVCLEKTGCSWPSGMKCQPSGSKVLQILRWYCTKQTPEQERNRVRRANNQIRSRRSLFGSAGSAFITNKLLPSPQPRSINQQQGYAEVRGPRDRRQQERRAAGSHIPRRRFTREERRSKRVKRLVRKLSRSFRGYYCEWNRDKYTLQPDCTCQC